MSTATQTATDVSKEVERVFALQQAHQWDVKASNAEQRKAKLAKLKAAVEAHANDIVSAVLQDTRKPEGEIRVTEVMNITSNIQRNIDNLDEWMKPTEVTPSLNPSDKAQILHEARGVCLILGPWNFPLGLTFGPLAAAVAAGNCCMVKLTDLCPATAQHREEDRRGSVRRKRSGSLRRRCQRCHRPARPAVQPHLLHRQHPRWQDRDGGRRQAPCQRHAGTGRQEPRDHR